MSHHFLISSWRALLASIALIAAVPVARLAADTPGSTPAAAQSNKDRAVEAQLETARKNLEQAAQDVARLSAELSTRAIDEVMPMFMPGHTILGVQLERAGDNAGARVREVSPGGPAAEAGIQVGDVIVAVNGTTLTRGEPSRQVLNIMRDVKADSRINVRVLRDGKPRDFTIVAREAPVLFATTHGMPDLPAMGDIQGAFMFRRPLMDLELVTLTPGLGSYFGADKGVLVVRAPADGALKLQEGDVILAIDGRQPTSGSHATRILGSYQAGEKITLRVLRQHKTLELEATLPEHNQMYHNRVRHELPDMPRLPPRTVIFGSNTA